MHPSIYPIQNETITEAGSVTLSCNASGMPSPMVSWIEVGGNTHTGLSELVFTNIHWSEAREHRCEVTNECGNASEATTIIEQLLLDALNVTSH